MLFLNLPILATSCRRQLQLDQEAVRWCAIQGKLEIIIVHVLFDGLLDASYNQINQMYVNAPECVCALEYAHLFIFCMNQKYYMDESLKLSRNSYFTPK